MKSILMILVLSLTASTGNAAEPIFCQLYQEFLATNDKGATVKSEAQGPEVELDQVDTDAGSFYQGSSKLSAETQIQLKITMMGAQKWSQFTWTQTANIISSATVYSARQDKKINDVYLYNPTIATMAAGLNRTFPGDGEILNLVES